MTKVRMFTMAMIAMTIIALMTGCAHYKQEKTVEARKEAAAQLREEVSIKAVTLMADTIMAVSKEKITLAKIILERVEHFAATLKGTANEDIGRSLMRFYWDTFKKIN